MHKILKPIAARVLEEMLLERFSAEDTKELMEAVKVIDKHFTAADDKQVKIPLKEIKK